MASKESSPADRILRRIRAALADLDRNTAVAAEDRLEVLYAAQYEIMQRLLEDEGNGVQSGTKWIPIWY